MTKLQEWMQRCPKNATHIIVVCDTFSYEDYPVFILDTDSLEERKKEFDGKNMQRIMEVIELKPKVTMENKKSILEEIQEQTEKLLKNNPQWRKGQAFFNACSQISADLANSIRSSVIDPFYNDDNIEECKKFFKNITKENIKFSRPTPSSERTPKDTYITILESRWQSTLKSLADAESEIENLQDKMENVVLEKNDAIEYRANLLSQILKIQGELNYSKQSYTNEKAMYERRIADLLKDLDATKVNNKNFLEHIKEFDNAFQESKLIIEGLRKKISELENQSKLNEHMALKLVQWEQENNKLKEQNNRLTSDLDKFACPHQRYEHSSIYIRCGTCIACKLDASNKILEARTTEIVRLTADNKRLKDVNASVTKRNDKYQSVLTSIAHGVLWPWERKQAAKKALSDTI